MELFARTGGELMQGTISRRSALKLLLSTGSAALVVACGPGAPAAAPTSPPATAKPAAAPTTAPAAAPAAQPTAAPTAPPAAAKVATTAPAAQGAAPKPGGTLRLGIASEPANVDGHIRTPGSDVTYWLAFDRLIYYDDKA